MPGTGLLELLLVIALIGVVVWLIYTYIPMPPVFRTIIVVVAAIAVIWYLISALGGMHHPVVR